MAKNNDNHQDTSTDRDQEATHNVVSEEGASEASDEISASSVSTNNNKKKVKTSQSRRNKKRRPNQSVRRRSPRHRQPPPPRPVRRRTSRGPDAVLYELAQRIVNTNDTIVFVTGAGLSVPSGIRPFRTQTTAQHSGLWNDVLWSTATKASFVKDPLKWYNDFWFPHFSAAASSCGGGSEPQQYAPNPAHLALNCLLNEFPHVVQVSQNIDGLQPQRAQMVQVHGRLGTYRCVSNEDSDTDSDSDDDRPVHLGHRRKSRLQAAAYTRRRSRPCPYQFLKCWNHDELEWKYEKTNADHSKDRDNTTTTAQQQQPRLKAPPRCPQCGNLVLPTALLFDEGYHAHQCFQFQRVEDWLSAATVLVFVGTSCSVNLTRVSLAHAQTAHLPVYNLNLYDKILDHCGSSLLSSSQWNSDNNNNNTTVTINNVSGDCAELLPQLLAYCRDGKQR